MTRCNGTRMVGALTIDVEDYFHFHFHGNGGSIAEQEWSALPSHIERNTDRFLSLLAETRTRATFFVLGWVAERFPQVVRRIHATGHELGCHSYSHRLIYGLAPREFAEDTKRALAAIEDAAGVRVTSYRAPCFSITPSSTWAIGVLLELGITTDSSMFPVRHDTYGFPDIPRVPFRIRVQGRELVECPPPTIVLGGLALPVTGGGYLRMFPMAWQCFGLRRCRRSGHPGMIYVHPWEIDSDIPPLPMPWLFRKRHFAGVRNVEERLRHFLTEFEFSTLSESLASAPVSHRMDLELAAPGGMRMTLIDDRAMSLQETQ